jgi:hypothetical protein
MIWAKFATLSLFLLLLNEETDIQILKEIV